MLAPWLLRHGALTGGRPRVGAHGWGTTAMPTSSEQRRHEHLRSYGAADRRNSTKRERRGRLSVEAPRAPRPALTDTAGRRGRSSSWGPARCVTRALHEARARSTTHRPACSRRASCFSSASAGAPLRLPSPVTCGAPAASSRPRSTRELRLTHERRRFCAGEPGGPGVEDARAVRAQDPTGLESTSAGTPLRLPSPVTCGAPAASSRPRRTREPRSTHELQRFYAAEPNGPGEEYARDARAQDPPGLESTSAGAPLRPPPTRDQRCSCGVIPAAADP